jgi:hypothetical protein
MAEGYQRREYGSKTGAEGEDKLQSSSSLEMIKAGPPSVGTGPTGSSRSYPKGSGLSLTPDFNPMKAGKPTYGVDGV